MILDGEENESLGVLLEQRLVHLPGLGGSGHSLLCLHLGLVVLRVDLGLEGSEVGVKSLVLFVGGGEVQLLYGRLHREVLNCSSSLL